MSATAEQSHQEGSKKLFMVVWVSLLVLTGCEVFLAYQNLELKVMLIILMTLSIVKASLIISYFMHLRFERTSLALTLMPALVFVIVMMFMAFPDSVRLYEMRPK
jgi:cytochrome c oxidase subunit IV